MAIVRWDPFSLQSLFRWPRWLENWEWDWSEPRRGLRIQETDDNIIAEAVIAGVPADDVEVTIENGVLRIKAETEKKEKKDQKYQAYKYFYTAALSGGDWSKAKAEVKNGIITVTIPKVSVAKPKKIKVTAKKK